MTLYLASAVFLTAGFCEIDEIAIAIHKEERLKEAIQRFENGKTIDRIRAFNALRTSAPDSIRLLIELLNEPGANPKDSGRIGLLALLKKDLKDPGLIGQINVTLAAIVLSSKKTPVARSLAAQHIVLDASEPKIGKALLDMVIKSFKEGPRLLEHVAVVVLKTVNGTPIDPSSYNELKAVTKELVHEDPVVREPVLKESLSILRKHNKRDVNVLLAKALFTAFGQKSARNMRSIFDLMDEAEKARNMRQYLTYMEASVLQGTTIDPISVKLLARGFEGVMKDLLIRNLQSIHPHARVDAGIALRQMFGKEFGYNPIDSENERLGAIKRWKEFSVDAWRASKAGTDKP